MVALLVIGGTWKKDMTEIKKKRERERCMRKTGRAGYRKV